MRKIFRILKKMIICVLFLVLTLIITLLLMRIRVDTVGKNQIVNVEQLPKEVDAVIVLGAGLNSDGTPSAILEDRLKTSISVFDYINKGKLILSGDHGSSNYNEVKAMKNYIINNMNINESNVFLDHAGFSTYESIYRAKEIFNVKKAIIVTNGYHLSRALYISKRMGIEAYGVASDLRQYRDISNYIRREKIAQIKDYIYVNILKPEPSFLGDSIPIQSSDGRVTDK